MAAINLSPLFSGRGKAGWILPVIAGHESGRATGNMLDTSLIQD